MKTLRLLCLSLSLGLILLNSGQSFAEETAAEEVCIKLATIYEHDICESDIALEEKLEKNLREYASKSKNKPDKVVKDYKMSSLFGLIWEKAIIRKYGEDALTASKKEINAYVKSFKKSVQQQHNYDKKLSQLITDLLKENQYSEENYHLLNKIGMQKQKSIMMMDMQEKMPAEMKKKMAESQRIVAENAVKSWKVKKLLYEDYGGQIIFQQAGLEPLDGFKALLGEVMAKGVVTIHDRAYKDVFEVMEDYVDLQHNVIPADSPEIKKYFASPSWLYSGEIAEEAFAMQKKQLMKIKPLPMPEEAPEEKSDKKEESEE